MSTHLLTVEWEITDVHLPMAHIIALAVGAFVEDGAQRGFVVTKPPQAHVQHALRLIKVTGQVEPATTGRVVAESPRRRRCPACGMDLYEVDDQEVAAGDDAA